VLLGAVLAVGSVHVVSAIVVALASGVVATLLLWDYELPRTALLPCLAALALSAYCALQALPLPYAVTSALAKGAVAIWDRSLEPAGITLAWVPLSLDPGASLVEATQPSSRRALRSGAATGSP
jgi:hypothetical protein